VSIEELDINLEQYIQMLIGYYKKYPNVKLIYSIDDEGNEHKEVIFLPTIGIYDGESFKPIEKGNPNAICIN